MKPPTLNMKFAFLATAMCLLLVARPVTRSAGSLSDLDIEYNESKVAFERISGENILLQNALTQCERASAEFRKASTTASGETEIFKRQTTQMKLRMDALGLDSVGGNGFKLEQRLLAAISNLRATVGEKRKLSEALVRLTDAASLHAKTAIGVDLQSRLSLEAEIRNANVALGVTSVDVMEGGAIPSTVAGGRVISVKEELTLVVMNLGSRHGIKVGMPFQVARSGELVGSVRIVDVREKIAGAVIQNLSSDKNHIRVGDLLKVDAQQ